MNSKSIIIFAFVILASMGGFFALNPSYEKSIQAKFYYETGDYKQALSLAKEAFSLDVYNRMSSTIMAQSLLALKYVAYNEDAKKYMAQINEIAQNEYITDAQRAKIRLMCQIMVDSYVKLAPSVITDKELVAKSREYNLKFEKLLEKVNR